MLAEQDVLILEWVGQHRMPHLLQGGLNEECCWLHYMQRVLHLIKTVVLAGMCSGLQT